MDLLTFNIYFDFVKYHNANLCGIYNPLKEKDLIKKKSNLYFLNNIKNIKTNKLKPVMNLPEIKYQMYSIPDINSDRKKFTNVLISCFLTYCSVKSIRKSEFLMSFYFLNNMFNRSVMIKYLSIALIFRIIYLSFISSEQKY